jgi:hypothetical protein
MTQMCSVLYLFKCCALLGCYESCNGNSLPTFWHNMCVSSLRVEKSLLRDIPDERRSHLLCGGSRKWPLYVMFITCINRPQFFVVCNLGCDII